METRRILKPRRSLGAPTTGSAGNGAPQLPLAATPLTVVANTIDLPPWPPSTPLPELTADIWRYVFKYLSQYPLMHRARPVCKSWKTFADTVLQRECVVYLSDWTHMAVHDYSFASRYPDLRSLVILSFAGTYSFLQSFTRLEALSLRASTFSLDLCEILPSLHWCLTRLDLVDVISQPQPQSQLRPSIACVSTLTALRHLELSMSDSALETVSSKVLWKVLSPLTNLTHFGWRNHLGISTTFINSLRNLTSLDLAHSATEHGLKLFRLFPPKVTTLTCPVSSMINNEHFARISTLTSLCIVIPSSTDFVPLDSLCTSLTHLSFLSSSWVRGLRGDEDTLPPLLPFIITTLSRNQPVAARLKALTIVISGELATISERLDLEDIRVLLPHQATLNLHATVSLYYSIPTYWPIAVKYVTNFSIYLAKTGSFRRTLSLIASFLASVPDDYTQRSISFLFHFAARPATFLQPQGADMELHKQVISIINKRVPELRARNVFVRFYLAGADEIENYDRPFDASSGYAQVQPPFNVDAWWSEPMFHQGNSGWHIEDADEEEQDDDDDDESSSFEAGLTSSDEEQILQHQGE